MADPVIYIPVEPLTPEAYRPFGHVVGMPSELPMAQNEERSFWGSPEIRIEDGAFMAVYVRLRMGDYTVRRLHRHRLFDQTLVPLGGNALVHVVAPPGDQPDLEAIRAFLIAGDQAVIIGCGTWHRNPAYPLAPEASLILFSRNATVTGSAAAPDAATVGGDTDRVDLSVLSNAQYRLFL